MLSQFSKKGKLSACTSRCYGNDNSWDLKAFSFIDRGNYFAKYIVPKWKRVQLYPNQKYCLQINSAHLAAVSQWNVSGGAVVPVK